MLTINSKAESTNVSFSGCRDRATDRKGGADE